MRAFVNAEILHDVHCSGCIGDGKWWGEGKGEMRGSVIEMDKLRPTVRRRSTP